MTSETKSSWPNNVGIHAIEIYVPQRYVDQTELETFDEVSAGKYTIGLGQAKMGFCTDREDINSLCLTVVQNLMERHKIGYDQIGRLEVGTETILDKSKSVKTVLMQLFEQSGNSDIEGVDTTNACYGGTAALFNSVSWLESSAWDGRYAIVVAGDIAVYATGAARPTGGAGAVAILLGADAPLILERGLRASHSAHVYDFYKPDLESEYPRVDGKLSIQCYLSALDKCYQAFAKKALRINSERITLESFDGVVFHSPYCKLVQKSLARLLLNDVIILSSDELSKRYPDLLSLKETKLENSYFDRDLETKLLANSKQLFESKTKASLVAANQVGNMYTASVYGGLVSYLISRQEQELRGNRICMFSYGSGLQASMFSFRVSGTSDKLSALLNGLSGVSERLNSRVKVDPSDFAKTMMVREETHHKAPYVPVGSIDDMLNGTYYLESVDDMHRRQYCRKVSK
ncbi:Hydroxymethylglutaryl-CoA synthase 1 [Orchesella cincta]|uniref:Hydroxymethylglutaryl-CoA synthase n=1 Tax=Orchesella cincta TaxID=48709 RepID=A0A1D2NJ40_ORCCI|nr:Hydroxymethylglutaryl-CoA synthase 1 [Orchesella cincta]